MNKHKTYKLEFTVDPPMNCPEFGEWSGDPNIALKGKHGLVTITVDAEAKPSLDWFINLIKPIVNEYVITGYDEVE